MTSNQTAPPDANAKALTRRHAAIRRRLQEVIEDGAPKALAKAAELRWISSDQPGFNRRRCGRGFSYRHPDGSLVRDPELRRRFTELVIPPAWIDVWICVDPRGHVQATGVDAAGRKQYRYHDRWSLVRDAKKFSRMVPFGRSLPRLRRRIRDDLRRPELDRRRVLATAARLLDTVHLRVGNRRYTEQNESYGLTTLEHDHVEVDAGELTFSFIGKSGQEREGQCTDPQIARVVRECLEIPGDTLLRYLDAEGEPQTIDSGDVNGYLGDGFTAKDFRTWSGTVLAIEALLDEGPDTEDPEPVLRTMVCEVSEQLGNTPATCREYYIHPRVFEAYRDDRLEPLTTTQLQPIRGLRKSEVQALELLDT